MNKRICTLILTLLTLLVITLSAQPQEADPSQPFHTISSPGVPSWREDLQKGDILLCRTPDSPFFCLDFMKNLMDWTHMGIYDGNGGVIEGWYPAAQQTTIESWDYPSKEAVRVVRVRGVTYFCADSAVAFAESKLGLGYDFVFLQKNMRGDRWYCSELVWASYKQSGVDLDPDAFVVTPDEIAECPRVELVGEHIEYWEPGCNVNDDRLASGGQRQSEINSTKPDQEVVNIILYGLLP